MQLGDVGFNLPASTGPRSEERGDRDTRRRCRTLEKVLQRGRAPKSAEMALQ